MISEVHEHFCRRCGCPCVETATICGSCGLRTPSTAAYNSQVAMKTGGCLIFAGGMIAIIGAVIATLGFAIAMIFWLYALASSGH